MFPKNFTESLLLTLLFFHHTCLCMHVESYWESWVLKDYPDDWCALLKEVPASPVGSKEGSNYICIGIYSSEFDITFLKVSTSAYQKFSILIQVAFKLYESQYFVAFGDFSGGFGGVEVNDSIVIEGIEAIHSKGGKAKVAYGGALYDMSSFIHNKYNHIHILVSKLN